MLHLSRSQPCSRCKLQTRSVQRRSASFCTGCALSPAYKRQKTTKHSAPTLSVRPLPSSLLPFASYPPPPDESYLRKRIQELQTYRKLGLTNAADIEKYDIDLVRRVGFSRLTLSSLLTDVSSFTPKPLHPAITTTTPPADALPQAPTPAVQALPHPKTALPTAQSPAHGRANHVRPPSSLIIS